MKLNILFLSLISLLSGLQSYAQDDLMDMLDSEVGTSTEEVAYTFKSTHIVNSHTIERMKTGQLDFRVNHRFGEISDGWYEFWGLDNAEVSLDFGYGITNWLMAGLRRSSSSKLYDGSLKFSIARQTKGANAFPVAISYYTNMGLTTLKDYDTLPFTNRLSYTNQILIARKFNEMFSLQIMPTYVHRNLVNFDEENDILSVGIGGRIKVHRRIALTFEYFWASQTADNPLYYNPLSFGVDIETGGHVFQLFFSNSRSMEESSFISQTTGSWLDGGIFFGFNISRVFATYKPGNENPRNAIFNY